MGYVMKHWKTTILQIIINQVFLNWIVVSAPNLITMSKVWDYISLGTPTLHISMHIQNDRLSAKDISNSLFLNEELRILALNLLEICSWNLMPMGNLPYPIQPHGILLDVTQESLVGITRPHWLQVWQTKFSLSAGQVNLSTTQHSAGYH